MVTSFEQSAYNKALEIQDIDLHIDFLRKKLDEVYSLKLGTVDSDKNIVRITRKISYLRTKKSKLKSKIYQLTN